jgi:hypothetical protein
MNMENVVDFTAYKEARTPAKNPQMSEELVKAIEVLIQRLKDAEPLKRSS